MATIAIILQSTSKTKFDIERVLNTN